MARQQFALATALLPDFVMRPDLRLLRSLLREMAQPGQDLLVLLVQANRETPRELS